MFFHNYPYSDAHELNLDWLISQIKQINTTLNNFIVMNTIKYADPFQWNITTQYESNTIVMEPNTGVAYISVQPVPAGISISNTDFWTAVFDLSQLFSNFNDNISFHNEYLNIVSAHVYDVNDWLIWKNELYLVTAAISLGDALQPGTNIQRKTVEELVGAISSEITTNILPRLTAVEDDITDNIIPRITAAEGNITAINGKIAKYHIINAVEIGCDNTGTVDCGPVINAHTIPVNSILYFPEGTYLVDTDIYLPSHCIVTGEKATIDTSVQAFNISSSQTDIIIKNLNFTGHGSGTSVGVYMSSYVTNCTVCDCTFKDMTSSVSVWCASDNIIRNNFIYNTKLGIYVAGDAGANLIASNNQIIGNCIATTTDDNGIRLYRADYCLVSGNIMSGCFAFSASLKECINSVISNNISIDSKLEAYNLQDCIECSITDNLAQWFTPSGTDFGISVWGTGDTSVRSGGQSKENIVKLNSVYHSFKNGIALAGWCLNDSVIDNYMFGCSRDTIDLGSGGGVGLGAYGGIHAPAYCIVRGNTIIGNGVTQYGIKEAVETYVPNDNLYGFNIAYGTSTGNMFSFATGTHTDDYNIPSA